ncbi:hypothetical protein BT67DRAFT_243815 [Trichocladium antarcticum]|uniref:Uncharacterized protein n=1 Tax=Trichocladium antarcticum TaxID=1450529 RepID=A0AAN6ZA16_9PEZI|nr:hypothetical protein BT67DRAFT_243815 [Trichocladium antarcticum]
MLNAHHMQATSDSSKSQCADYAGASGSCTETPNQLCGAQLPCYRNCADGDPGSFGMQPSSAGTIRHGASEAQPVRNTLSPAFEGPGRPNPSGAEKRQSCEPVTFAMISNRELPARAFSTHDTLTNRCARTFRASPGVRRWGIACGQAVLFFWLALRNMTGCHWVGHGIVS